MSASNGEDAPEADVVLLAELRAAVRATDPPPAELREIALRAQGWDVELERLAELVYDSAEPEVAGMRSTGLEVRDRTYSVSDMTIEVTTEPEGDAWLVEGVVDPRVDSVALMQPGQDPVTVKVDPHGRFTVVTTASVVSIAVVDAEGRLVRTPLFDVS